MFHLFIALFVFCLILFIYLHVHFHCKTSDDLEIYEIDQASKDKLEEICDLRQPVLFDFDNDKIMQHSCRTNVLKQYHAFEIKIRNTQDTNFDESEMYMPLPLHSSVKLFNEDKNGHYFSENNAEMLNDTGIIKHFQHNDEFIRPYMVSNCQYDIMMGSENTQTPFRYELNYRNYFLVTEGTIRIKMAPPKSTKYLHTVYDYENFEFRSPIHPWTPQQEYMSDFDKIKCLEVVLTAGKTIQIPAYWWYSIQFSKDASVSCFRYKTYMNNLAILPYIAMHGLQLQNIKRETVKKIDISERAGLVEEVKEEKEEEEEKENKKKKDIKEI